MVVVAVDLLLLSRVYWEHSVMFAVALPPEVDDAHDDDDDEDSRPVPDPNTLPHRPRSDVNM